MKITQGVGSTGRRSATARRPALNLGDGKLAGVGMSISGVIEDGMAQMSQKLNSMGRQLSSSGEG